MFVRSSTHLAVFAGLALIGALSGCNKTKKTTKDDCERWARHFGEIMQNESDARSQSCKDGVAMSLQLGALALGDKGGLETFTESCNKSDATFDTKPEGCYLAAKTVKDAQACGFYPPFKDAKSDFKAMLGKVETDLAKKCQSSLDDLPPADDKDDKKAADDDDDDKAKKKKKKAKTGDDDD